MRYGLGRTKTEGVKDRDIIKTLGVFLVILRIVPKEGFYHDQFIHEQTDAHGS